MASVWQERLAAIKREQEQEEVRECSFRPAINGRSSRLMSDRSTVLKVPGATIESAKECFLLSTVLLTRALVSNGLRRWNHWVIE